MAIPFETTRSYVYRATRYEVLPILAERAQVFGEEPFLLRELSKQVLSELYDDSQLDTLIKKEQSEKLEKMRTIFGFYIPFLAENLQVFEKEGEGFFKNISIDEEVADADAEATDVESDDSGFIYAYSFPTIQNSGARFPIKIGLTTGNNPEDRVNRQCRQTCCFEHPVILGKWFVQRVASVESAIHATLDARGFKRDAPGAEWFDTTIEEIESIVNFVDEKARPE